MTTCDHKETEKKVYAAFLDNQGDYDTNAGTIRMACPCGVVIGKSWGTVERWHRGPIINLTLEETKKN